LSAKNRVFAKNRRNAPERDSLNWPLYHALPGAARSRFSGVRLRVPAGFRGRRV